MTGVKYCGRAGRGGGNDSNPRSYHRLFNNILRTETPLYKEEDRIMMILTHRDNSVCELFLQMYIPFIQTLNWIHRFTQPQPGSQLEF